MKRSILAIIYSLCLLLPATGSGDPLDPSQAVNVAGSQRMLSQRIFKAYCQVALDEYFGEPDQQIKDGVAQFERNMTNLTPYISEGEAAAAAAQVRQYWGEYKPLVTAKPTVENAHKLFDISEQLLDASQKMVGAIHAATGIKTGALVSLAGRQRMLSQRMALFHMMKLWGISDDAIEKKAQQAHVEFTDALDKLMKEPRNTPEITANLNAVAHSLKLLDYSLKSQDKLTYTVAMTSEKILKDMDEVTRSYAALEQPAGK